jgi:hypothetical protein
VQFVRVLPFNLSVICKPSLSCLLELGIAPETRMYQRKFVADLLFSMVA